MLSERGSVVAVAASAAHGVSKSVTDVITLVAGVGVVGDAHAGSTVQHRSRVAQDPTKPNLRQVHLIHQELLDELNAAGFDVSPGAMGENITTTGVPLLDLPVGTTLAVGDALLCVTGLRNPCYQLDGYRPGLMAAVTPRDESGEVIRKAGVMSVVVAGGEVRAGDEIRVALPPTPHRRLDRV